MPEHNHELDKLMQEFAAKMAAHDEQYWQKVQHWTDMSPDERAAAEAARVDQTLQQGWVRTPAGREPRENES